MGFGNHIFNVNTLILVINKIGMKALQKFFRTTVIGGFLAVLPLALVIALFRWLILKVADLLSPLVSLFYTERKIEVVLLYFISFIAIVIVFFLIGLIVRTRIGIFMKITLEKRYLMKLPAYKTARELVMQFTGKNRTFFSAVVIVDVFNTGTLMTGFVTDRSDDYVSVFVPTGPNPTSGNIFHVRKEYVYETNTPVDEAMKTIISCGSGSSPLLQIAQMKMKGQSGS